MKGTENFLVRYMDGNNKRFIIPVYQHKRIYDVFRPVLLEAVAELDSRIIHE